MMTRSLRPGPSISQLTGIWPLLSGVWLTCGLTQAQDIQCDVPASHDDCPGIISRQSTAADGRDSMALTPGSLWILSP
jgi:hypothetical protein